MVYLTLFYVHWCEGVRTPGTGSSDSCELPCGCWELNPGPQEEQSVLLTTDPSLQPLRTMFTGRSYCLILHSIFLHVLIWCLSHCCIAVKNLHDQRIS